MYKEITDKTPNDLGFRFPAEWEKQRATWLSFPKNLDTWEDRLPKVYESYLTFIKYISLSQKVAINCDDDLSKNHIIDLLNKAEIEQHSIEFYIHKTNDSWCRDHGPTFLKNDKTNEKALINWEYNAWGGKYPPYDDDNKVPIKIAKSLNLSYFSAGIVMEGGSVEVNGKGALLTSESCLLNENRNPTLTKLEIEKKLMNYYCVEQILWVKDGIVGDDTDGHIDDTTRFINEDSILTCVESNKMDENFKPLKENIEVLKKMKLLNGKNLNIIELPMPSPVYSKGVRLPASYANFCVTNQHIIVPTYRCKTDEIALDLIQTCFKDREVIGIDSTEIIWGLGSFHCLSQQEPE